MKDDYYRGYCEYPKEYDAIVDWIAKNNPAAQVKGHMYGDTPEQFACGVVHACINAVMFGNAGAFMATGMCIAIRLSSNPNVPKKVILAIQGRNLPEYKA